MRPDAATHPCGQPRRETGRADDGRRALTAARKYNQVIGKGSAPYVNELARGGAPFTGSHASQSNYPLDSERA